MYACNIELRQLSSRGRLVGDAQSNQIEIYDD